eukprot:6201336-Pleurochrysis_carterae.AAC.4
MPCTDAAARSYRPRTALLKAAGGVRYAMPSPSLTRSSSTKSGGMPTGGRGLSLGSQLTSDGLETLTT